MTGGGYTRGMRIAGRMALLAGCAVLMVATASTGCQRKVRQDVWLATTTSVVDSGLLTRVLPTVEAETGTHLVVLPVGSGKAGEMARKGEVDLILTHAPDVEAALLAERVATSQRALFWNDFVVVGPKD